MAIGESGLLRVLRCTSTGVRKFVDFVDGTGSGDVGKLNTSHVSGSRLRLWWGAL